MAIRGIDPINGAVIEYVPTANLLDLTFFVKVVSLIDAMVHRRDRDQLLLLSLLGKSDGRPGVGENLLPLMLLQTSSGAVLDPDLIRLLLLIRSTGTSAEGAAKVLVMQYLMQSFPRTDGSGDVATGRVATDSRAQGAERPPDTSAKS
jgi:hypothetical protein